MISEMASIAVSCFRNPRLRAVWSPTLRAYVCPETETGRQVLARDAKMERTAATAAMMARHPPIDAQFKLVFITAAVGTFFFTVICVAATIAAGKDPPPLLTELVKAMADLAKIGFGAIVGLLGGKTLQRESAPSEIPNLQRDGSSTSGS
jgi:hypothetical protein